MQTTLNKFLTLFLLLGSWFTINPANAQQIDTTFVNYREPKKLRLTSIDITGTQYLDKNIIRSLTGLKIGEIITVPGDDITKCLKNLWKQGLFGNVKIYAGKMDGDSIALVIDVVEKPRLNEIILKGLKKSDKEDIDKKLNVLRGKPITDALKLNVKNTIVDQFEDKSYLHPVINVVEKKG